MLQAVVFDMDGVLVDSEPLGEQLDRTFFRTLGYEIDDSLFHKGMGLTVKKFIEMVKDHYDMPHDVDELAMQKTAFKHQEWERAELAPITGVREFIEMLLAHDLPLALASSSVAKRIDLFLTKLDLKEAFQVIVSGEHVEHSKPAPDIYLRAARELGIEPGNCIAIEDAEAGVASAKAAGMKVVGYKVIGSMQDLSHADLVVSDFSQLSIEALQAL